MQKYDLLQDPLVKNDFQKKVNELQEIASQIVDQDAYDILEINNDGINLKFLQIVKTMQKRIAEIRDFKYEKIDIFSSVLWNPDLTLQKRSYNVGVYYDNISAIHQYIQEIQDPLIRFTSQGMSVDVNDPVLENHLVKLIFKINNKLWTMRYILLQFGITLMSMETRVADKTLELNMDKLIDKKD